MECHRSSVGVARVVSLLFLALFLGGAEAQARALPSEGCGKGEIVYGDRQERTIDVDGVKRSFIVDVPKTIEARRTAPLLLDFHGFGHSAAGVWRVSGFRELGVRERFITVYPQGLDVHLLGRDGAGWELAAIDGNRELAFVRQMLDTLEAEYCIDRSRVYVTGFSNGAFLSSLIGCAMADRIAAIAPVSGGAADLPCTPSRPVSVLIHHGRKDQIVAVQRGRQLFDEWKRLDGCPGTRPREGGEACDRATDCRDGTAVVYCEFDGEHRWPAEATERIWEFFRTHPMTP